MRVSFSPLTAEEAQAVLGTLRRGRQSIRFIKHPDPIHDARPSSAVPLFVPNGTKSLRVAELKWEFPLDEKPHAVSAPA